MRMTNTESELAVLFSFFIKEISFGLWAYGPFQFAPHSSKHNCLPIRIVPHVLEGGVWKQLACDWADFHSVPFKMFSGTLGFE